MKAVLYKGFRQPLTISDVPRPGPAEHGAILRVEASGLCRSDWHGWMGNDPDIRPPHVPGHEFAGTIVELGKAVHGWKAGERVSAPFVCACGVCAQCLSGNHQVCDHQSQPGFTHWGSFAEYVAVEHADVNLVRLPDGIRFEAAASLGCRFATAFRAIVDQARVSAGQWVAIHGCGGVGLSAVMIASAVGANVVAIDITDEKLALARSVGAAETINASVKDLAGVVKEMTGGGAHVSLDAFGHPQTCFNAISGLRKRGKHVQAGLMATEHRRTPVPMDQIIARELELFGSHGMQAFRYPELLAMVQSGKVQPEKLIGRTISLEEAAGALVAMEHFEGTGITVINSF